MSTDHKNQVLLPYTQFPLRLNLETQNEIMQKWQTPEIIHNIPTAELFILHDGPTYTNGPAHMGHALNKIQKDFINRRELQKGKKVLYIPGFDCHGLPIESGVIKAYDTRNMTTREFRQKCREYAEHWINIQTQDFISYGIWGCGHQNYTTMDHKSEMSMLKNFHKIVKSGLVYRAKKPVWWSSAECTSLAEAELEYIEKKSTAIYVKFEVVSTPGEYIIIWTTTPWTLFANEAVAVSEEQIYTLVEIAGIKAWIAEPLLQSASNKLGAYNIIKTATGNELAKLKVINPIGKHVPVLTGDFVTMEDGTGIVHIAPAHGPDDFQLGSKNNLPITDSIDECGKLLALPHLSFTNDSEICDYFNKIILYQEQFTHNYPCSWRSKTPLVYRSTYQWFINIDKLRQSALDAIQKVEWFPSISINRISSMVKNRSDWCISRQRRWGMPLAIFHDENNNIRLDLLEQTQDFIEKNGVDAWFERANELAPDATPVMDIMDVWAESGMTTQIIKDQYSDFCIPADLYLEGSDQHRGWFQSSLMMHCALQYADNLPPCAPYKAVMTHGFVLDAHGRKMSKSLGNVISPDTIKCKDILRMVLLTVSTEDDVKFGKASIDRATDILARFRLTLRFALGNITDQDLSHVQLLPLERWILSCMTKVHKEYCYYSDQHKPELAIKAIYTFCNEELSAFYFDIRKDMLYCSNSSLENIQNPDRLSVVKCMDIIFNTLVRWLAPVTPFLSEEIWSYYTSKSKSVSIHQLYEPSLDYNEPELEAIYTNARVLRSQIYSMIEKLRTEGVIKSSSDASVLVPNSMRIAGLSESEMAELCIVTSFRYSDINDIQVQIAPGVKCSRCRFKYKTEASDIITDKCPRCTKVTSQPQSFNLRSKL